MQFGELAAWPGNQIEAGGGDKAMPRKPQAYVPSMSDAAVKTKTGKDWAGWFGALDKAGAAKLEHKAIANVLSDKHGLPGWWCQMVTVEYERARGLRVRHETAKGFAVAISKTVATSLSDLAALLKLQAMLEDSSRK
jgi:hypothetical protein